MTSTLLLNSSFEAIDIVPWERAVTLWVQKKVEVIETHDKDVHSVSWTFKMPSIVRLLKYVRIRKRPDHVPFTRGNVFARDGYRCQYDGQEYPTTELTFDHVVPISQGGRRSWSNIVACCIACNRKKDNRTPEQAGMKLLRQPRQPKAAPTIRLTVGVRNAPESWRSFLYFSVELEQD